MLALYAFLLLLILFLRHTNLFSTENICRCYFYITLNGGHVQNGTTNGSIHSLVHVSVI